MSANGQGPREKSRTPKPKSNTDSPVAATPSPTVQTPGPSALAVAVADPVSADINMDDGSKCLLDGKTASKFVTCFLLVTCY